MTAEQAPEKSRKKSPIGCWIGVAVYIALQVVYIGVQLHDTLSRYAGDRKPDYSHYILNFGTNFKAGMASVDDLGLSVVLAVDCSGSMADEPASGGGPKYEIASRSLAGIVDFLEDYYYMKLKSENLPLKIGLIRFNSVPETVFRLTEMNPRTFRDLERAVADKQSFRPGGQTAIGRTLEKAVEMIMESGSIFKSVVVITDGENTEGVSPDAVLRAVVNNSNNLNRKDSPVITSGILVSFICFDTGSENFTNLAAIGARVMTAGGRGELYASLRKIFVADITRLESK